MPYLEIILAAISGGAVSSLITALVTSRAARRKIEADAQEIEKRIRTSVLKSLQEHIDFLDTRIAKLQSRIQALERENELLRKKNSELENRLERYEEQSNTGVHEVIDVKRRK